LALLRHSVAALLAGIALPLGGLWLLLRPGDGRGLAQRLGAVPAGERGAIWIHGASVGEAPVVARVAEGLRGRGLAVRVSATTRAGLGRLGQLLPGAPRGLAPLDHPWCTTRALARAAPGALVLIETELWPGWLAAAARAGVPVVIASGRLAPAGRLRRWALRRLLRPGLAAVAGVAAASAEDAERFRALGLPAERVRVGGDLKRALEPPAAPPGWAASLSGLPVWIAASTHAGEEEVVLDAHARCGAGSAAPVLVLAPRQPERFDAVHRLCAARGPVWRRSSGGLPAAAPGDVWLLDSLGELAALLPLAHVVFVGGSLVPVGGHDPWLAVRAGCAVLAGPHLERQPEARRALFAADPGALCRDASELAAALAERLREPRGARLTALRSDPGAAGALDRQLDWLLAWTAS